MKENTSNTGQSYEDLLEEALAHAIAEGDIVNFRLIFMPSSPFRPDSPEDASTAKYDYLFSESPEAQQYREALALVRESTMAAYVREELDRKGPPRLPWQLVLALGDNATRLGKYTAASQAYELLRIRRRMQDLTLEEADAALAGGNIRRAVQGYRIALGLQYDYSAFPEPLPAVPDYQERAPALHMVYPASPEQTLALQGDEKLCRVGLGYLMPFNEFTSRFQQIPEDKLIDFTAGVIRTFDQTWEKFVTAFREALQRANACEAIFAKLNTYSAEALEVLSEDIVDAQHREDLRHISTALVEGSDLQWEWWQYVKTLAYHHPGAALFVTRQRISAKEEILIPKCGENSRLAHALGLIG